MLNRMPLEATEKAVDAFKWDMGYTPSPEQIKRISDLLTSITRLSRFSEERMNKFELRLKQLQEEFMYGRPVTKDNSDADAPADGTELPPGPAVRDV